jgi:hypothetical protein
MGQKSSKIAPEQISKPKTILVKPKKAYHWK